MVLAYDEKAIADAHVVSKRLFDVEAINVYGGHVAFTIDGYATTFIIDGGHSPAAIDRLEEARALNAAAADDSENEPPDFVVDDGFDI